MNHRLNTDELQALVDFFAATREAWAIWRAAPSSQRMVVVRAIPQSDEDHGRHLKLVDGAIVATKSTAIPPTRFHVLDVGEAFLANKDRAEIIDRLTETNAGFVIFNPY